MKFLMRASGWWSGSGDCERVGNVPLLQMVAVFLTDPPPTPPASGRGEGYCAVQNLGLGFGL